MSAEKKLQDPVRMELTRTVTIDGIDGKPGLELRAVSDNVTASPLPRNGSRRAPVRLADLIVAVDQLKR